MKLSLMLLTFIVTTSVFGQTQRQRIEDIYISNDQNYELSCYYFGPNKFRLITAVNSTTRMYGQIEREFNINSNGKSIKLNFKVSSSDRREGKYQFKFDNGLVISGEIKNKSSLIYSNGKNAFYIPTKKVDRRFKGFVSQNEIYKISCKVHFAMAKKVDITDLNNELHVNVHPHDKYDHKQLTVEKTQSYYQNSSYNSFVLLEEGNFKGNLVALSNFLEMKEYNLVKNYFPESVIIPENAILKVSPAGHNRYNFKAQETVQITYTGGNHNYCMWNNTRRVLMSYMRSKTEAPLILNYDTSAIVVQAGGLVGLSFNSASLRKNNLLADVLNFDKKQARDYTQKYYNYFVNIFVGPYKGLFKQVTINNDSVFGKYSKVIRGSGKRVLNITLKYSNL